MTYKEAIMYIKQAEKYGSVLGLDSMRTLLSGLGNPEDKLKFVHIAGTNGKGSTSAFIANILATAGYRTGRFISPSVFDYLEKIQITQPDTKKKDSRNESNFSVITQYIMEDEVAEYTEKISKVCQDMVKMGLSHPTVFEMETAMAMLYFVKRKCDIVVMEVGLGGRLDATNVIRTTVCSVITSISMDHMAVLGNTLEQIAAEKAGIIKPDIPVVSYQQDVRAAKIIGETAKINNATLITADFSKISVKDFSLEGTEFTYDNSENLKIRLLGENQVKNAVVALLTAKALKLKGYSISGEQIRRGLFHTTWRGRFEILKHNPLFIIDGAHNEDAARALAQNLRLYFNGRKIFFILGVLADKDYNAVLRHTASYATRIYTITPNNRRGLNSGILSKAATNYHKAVVDARNVSNAISLAYQAAGKEDVIIAFGSLSYLKEVYHELGIVPFKKTFELI